MARNKIKHEGFRKALAVLSAGTFLLIVAALANPYWLQVFKISLKGMQLEIKSDVGLLYSCTDTFTPVIDKHTYECQSLPQIDSDLVEEWQWACGGMGLAALLATFIAFIIASRIACGGGPHKRAQASIIFFYVLACILFVVVLVLVQENGDLKEYKRNWGYSVAAAGACTLFVMALLNLGLYCCVRSSVTV